MNDNRVRGKILILIAMCIPCICPYGAQGKEFTLCAVQVHWGGSHKRVVIKGNLAERSRKRDRDRDREKERE